jgi:hypothetical protein
MVVSRLTLVFLAVFGAFAAQAVYAQDRTLDFAEFRPVVHGAPAQLPRHRAGPTFDVAILDIERCPIHPAAAYLPPLGAGFDDIQFGWWGDTWEWCKDRGRDVSDGVGTVIDKSAEVGGVLRDQAVEVGRRVSDTATAAWNALAKEVTAFVEDPSAYSAEVLQAAVDSFKRQWACVEVFVQNCMAAFERFRENPGEWLQQHADTIRSFLGETYDQVVDAFEALREYMRERIIAVLEDPTLLTADAVNTAAGSAAGVVAVGTLGLFDLTDAFKSAEVGDTRAVEYIIGEVGAAMVVGVMLTNATLGLAAPRLAGLVSGVVRSDKLSNLTTSARSFVNVRTANGATRANAANRNCRLAQLDLDEQAGYRAIRRAVPAGPNQQVHHVIPMQHRSHDLVQRAARGGFDFHGHENGLALCARVHRGSHENYNERIRRALDTTLRDNPRISDASAARALREFVEREKRSLAERTTRLD